MNHIDPYSFIWRDPDAAWQDLLKNRSQMWSPCIHWRWKHWSLSSKVRGFCSPANNLHKRFWRSVVWPEKMCMSINVHFSSPKNLSIYWRSMHPFPHPSFFPNQKWQNQKPPPFSSARRASALGKQLKFWHLRVSTFNQSNLDLQ